MRAFFLSNRHYCANRKRKDAVDHTSFLLFMLFLFLLLRQGEGNTTDSYSKQHSLSEALFRPSPVRNFWSLGILVI